MTTVSTAPTGYTGPTRSHDDQREPREGPDQHKRPWNWQVEKKSGDFCGCPPQPSGWQPPFPTWLPPSRYMKCGRNFVINGRRLAMEEMHIDYTAWKAEARDSMASWQERLFQIGNLLAGDRFDPEDLSPQIVGAVGPKPFAVEIIMAMEQGNRFALGLTTLADERLRPYFPRLWAPPEPDFSEPDLGGTEVEASPVGVTMDVPIIPIVKRGPGRPKKVAVPEE